MTDENRYAIFPSRRIKPFDGMEITAEVWEESHNYHTQSLQFHNHFFHGLGILSGLEVVASDPADNMVYIMPGTAVDPLGRMLVLAEPVAYDFGDAATGTLYLSLSYREKERAAKAASEEAPRYLEQDFVLTARASLPTQTQIELARLTRATRNAPISNAADALLPQRNEIDLRYRLQVPLKELNKLSAGVVYLGKVKNKTHGRGLSAMAEELNERSAWSLIVEDNLKLDKSVLSYGLLYLVVEGEITWDEAQISTLKAFLDQDGLLFIENSDKAAADATQKLCEQLKINLKPVRKEHALLSKPWHFAEAPAGFGKEGELQAKDGVVVSSFNYGRLWFGECAEGTPSREAMRSAMEFGQNLVTYLEDQLG
jgi:hypothetical protein